MSAVVDRGDSHLGILSPSRRPLAAHIIVYAFVILPPLALVCTVPIVWGWGISWIDLAMFLVMYAVTFAGITVGYHRHFTHGAFRARRWLRIALALAAGMAVHGPIFNWVADHRRHHAYADREGDPHSPWLFGSSPLALAKGSGMLTWDGSSIEISPTSGGLSRTFWKTGTCV